MSVISFFKNLLPHKRLDKNHYGRFLGSFNFFRIISWNMFHPNMIINRLLWNTLFNFYSLKIKKYLREGIDKKLFSKFNFFLNNGGVIIDDYFNVKKINNFLHEYKNRIEDEKKLIINDGINISEYRQMTLPLSQPLLDLWLDDELIKFIESSLNNKNIYAREYPRLTYTKYFLEEPLTSKGFVDKLINKKINGPYFWHVDHTAGLVNLHVLLHDVDADSTRMQFLPGSNNYLNSRCAYSDEVVDSFKNQPINCIGKKGTVYFQQGNTLHKVIGKSNSERLTLNFSFSKGAGIEMSCRKIAQSFSTNFDLSKLSQKKRNILQGIFPLSRTNSLVNQNLIKPRFSENSSDI